MHVAQRHGDEACGNAPARHLNGPSVGTGDRRLGLQLVRNALRLGSGHEALEHHGVDVRPPRDDRTRPADDLAVLRFVDARIVRGVGDVEGERHVGVHGMGACHGAAGADLLLSGGHRDEVARGAAGAGQLLHDATGDPHAALVIEALRDGHVVAEPLESDAERDGVAHPHKLLHALGLHAQIDNEGGERRHRLALVRLDEVDGLAAHDAAEGAGSGVHVDPHAGQDGRVHAAQRGHGEEALVGDVGDHEADLVHMGRQHERGRTGVAALEYRAHRAHGVGGHFVGHISEPLAHQRGRRLLEARRRGRLHQLLQKLQMFLLHWFSCSIHR